MCFWALALLHYFFYYFFRAAHIELGSECASAYYRYGITLLERAQNNIGILGNKVEVVDEDEEDVDDDDEEEEEEEEGVEAMDAQQTAPAKDDKGVLCVHVVLAVTLCFPTAHVWHVYYCTTTQC